MSKTSQNDPVYDLESVTLPKLSGITLRLLTLLTESFLSGLIQKSLLDKAGITRFRKLEIDDLPTYYPDFPSETGKVEAPTNYDFTPPESNGFRFNSIADYNRAYREGTLNPVEVAERFLQAAADSDKGDRPLRAFIAIDRDDILKQAEASAERFKKGTPLGILDGVPVPVKDQFSVKGYPTTTGTNFMGSDPVTEDAAPVARLRNAGAIIAGKANMHELGLGVTGLNPHHGVTRNPYDPKHHTGGSSSGSATAVSAGLGPVSLGADGGGSIRIPSAFCGLVGLKPTFGRVSLHGDSQLCWSVEHVGPIAATAADAAVMYQTITGPDMNDRFTLNQPPVSLEGIGDRNLKGLKAGIYPAYFRHAEPETVAICEELLRQFEEMGVTVQEITIPGLEAGRVAHTVTIAAEISQSLERFYPQHHKDFGLDSRLNLSMARRFSSHDYLLAQRVRTRMIDEFNRILKDVDILLTPTTGIPAPPIPETKLPNGESDLTVLFEIMRFATPANMTGLPAISFPAGYTKDGLPVGMHATGRAWQEATLLKLASAAGTVVERKAPQVYFDLLAGR